MALFTVVYMIPGDLTLYSYIYFGNDDRKACTNRCNIGISILYITLVNDGILYHG